MTPAVDLTAYDAVILDFDGPMCNVFAGYPAAQIASELKQLLVEHGWPTEALPDTSDPHQILRLVHSQTPSMSPTIEAALTAAELAAVDTAVETPGLAALLGHLDGCRMPVAVASNNNAGAIRRWLNLHNYEIRHVVGRDTLNPSKMKPAPDVLLAALALLQIPTNRAVFVGDALTDAQAAAATGCAFLAFANKPYKIRLFAGLCCLTVTDLAQLAKAMGESSPS